MAEEIHEAVVALKPEGAEETQTALEDVTGEFESSTDEMQEQTQIMDKFSEKFQGAMGVAIAGLTVAAAGLASKVPVLGEAFAGLNAILTAVGMKVDGVLRPAISPIADWFFEIANATAQAKGPMGALIGVVGSIVLVLGTLAAIAASVGGAMGGVSGAISAVKTVFGAILGKISAFVSWLGSIVSGSLAAAAALGALVGVLTVGLLEVLGINDAIRRFGNMLAKGLPDWANTGLIAVLGIFVSILALIGAAVVGFVKGTLEGGLGEGLDQAVSMTKEMLDLFIFAWKDTLSNVGAAVGSFISFLQSAFTGGLQMVGSAVEDAANKVLSIVVNLADRVRGIFNNALRAIESTVNAAVREAEGMPGIGNLGTVNLGRVGGTSPANPTVQSTSSDIGGRGGGGNISKQLGNLVAAMQNNEATIPINIDGREVARAQQSYMGEGTENRGRSGE